MFGNLFWHLCCHVHGFVWVKEFATFGYVMGVCLGKGICDFWLCCGRLFRTEVYLSVTSENFKLVSQRKLTPFLCPTDH
jgi:hypothetical protein